MENWLFLFLGLILAYFLEFTRPWVKSYFEKKSLTTKQRRIYILISEYQQIKLYKQNSAIFIARLLRIIAAMIAGVTAALFFWFSAVKMSSRSSGISSSRMEFEDVWVVISSLAVFFLFYYLDNYFRKVSNFDSYKEKTIAKLVKLGGNPEDLDKEEG